MGLKCLEFRVDRWWGNIRFWIIFFTLQLPSMMNRWFVLLNLVACRSIKWYVSTVLVGQHGEPVGCMSASKLPSMNYSFSLPAAHTAVAIHDTPTTMPDCLQDTLVFVLLAWLPPQHNLDHLNQYLYLCLIRPQDMVPVNHVLGLLVLSKWHAFWWIIFRGGFLLLQFQFD